MRTKLPVSEIIVESGWRERLEAFAGRRRDSWVLIAVMVGAVVLGLVLWARGAPTTVAPSARRRPWICLFYTSDVADDGMPV
ncbi:hypothetical protein BH18ACT16_BH18ACT16_12970 [soil metagenome]